MHPSTTHGMGFADHGADREQMEKGPGLEVEEAGPEAEEGAERLEAAGPPDLLAADPSEPEAARLTCLRVACLAQSQRLSQLAGLLRNPIAHTCVDAPLCLDVNATPALPL